MALRKSLAGRQANTQQGHGCSLDNMNHLIQEARGRGLQPKELHIDAGWLSGVCFDLVDSSLLYEPLDRKMDRWEELKKAALKGNLTFLGVPVRFSLDLSEGRCILQTE